MYQLVDFATLLLVLQLLYCVHKQQRSEVDQLVHVVAGLVHREVSVLQGRRSQASNEVKDVEHEHLPGKPGNRLAPANLQAQKQEPQALHDGRASQNRRELPARELTPHDEPEESEDRVAHQLGVAHPRLVDASARLRALAAHDSGEEVNPVSNGSHHYKSKNYKSVEVRVSTA